MLMMSFMVSVDPDVMIWVLMEMMMSVNKSIKQIINNNQ